jgi:hypothetical protein
VGIQPDTPRAPKKPLAIGEAVSRSRCTCMRQVVWMKQHITSVSAPSRAAYMRRHHCWEQAWYQTPYTINLLRPASELAPHQPADVLEEMTLCMGGRLRR